ncbi:zona pellucida sperm-binding protein 4-like [Lampris incognitus]|uniref:zona pellucida sperm-binding protein 4-like n=1 Tax=Lampris incognitus TaxID=2546036 RepID=UPI0024B55DC2|nr:zona pellucida sperm-binding protein 4-like [Lampris incognitus]
MPKAPVLPVPTDKCQVEEADRLQCGYPGITAEQCKTIDCCFAGNQCFYGKAVTVQCTRDGQFIVVVARDATVPYIDIDSVSLLESTDASCNPADITAAFAIFQFSVTACGTQVTAQEDYVVYENHVSSSYEVGMGPRGSITRDSHFELLFQCMYSSTAVEALIMEVNTVPPPLPVAALGPLRVELKLANGQCRNKGCIEEKDAYTSFYTASDYPVTKVLREPLYVEVSILERTDPNIVLLLEHCWATSTPDPDGLPQWDILVDGCPYKDDRYLTTVIPVESSHGIVLPNHHKRFSVKMFAFVDQDTFTTQNDKVFLHCATAVCHPSSTTSCDQTCHRRRRRRHVAVKVAPNQTALVSSGEVILTAKPLLS